VLALFTPWGLMRHWWVLVKCGIAAALTITGLLLLLPRIQGMATGMGQLAELRTLIARSCALILLFVATGLSVMKPGARHRADAGCVAQAETKELEVRILQPSKQRLISLLMLMP
jgi:hypothetical protein